MGHIKPQPPRPPPPSPIRPDPDERDDIRALVRAINASTEASTALTEWLRANRAAVTRADLNAATEKILRAIQKDAAELSPQDQAILDNLSATAEAHIKRWEALAAQTP